MQKYKKINQRHIERQQYFSPAIEGTALVREVGDGPSRRLAQREEMTDACEKNILCSLYLNYYA